MNLKNDLFRKDRDINSVIDSILSKYNATCLAKKEQKISCDEEGESISLDVYISDVSIETVVEMNIELINEMVERNVGNNCVAPLFILSDKKSIEKIEEADKKEEVHCHGRYK